MKKKLSKVRLFAFVLLLCCTSLCVVNAQTIAGSAAEISTQWIGQRLTNAAKQYTFFATQIPQGLMPRSFTNDTLRTCKSDNWVAGFYPGTALFLSDATNNKALYEEAAKRVPLMRKEQYNTGTHDLGFMMFCSYGNFYKLHPTDSVKQILITSARSLATRFNSKVGCLRSWGSREDTSEFRVIIDNMMNLELLFWAAKQTNDKALYNLAVTHANTTMKNHFRPDFSSYHVVVYNPQSGAVMKKQTAQGDADSSAWARGQSWGLYGYTVMYRETKEKKYLDEAQRIAAFLLSNPALPANKIPYWDYNAPGIPAAYRDASAAAVMASALLELAQYSDASLKTRYRSSAQTILQTLASPEYTATKGTNGGFLLKHSISHLPKNVEVDAPQTYADYYYVEALLRFRNYLAQSKKG